ncbi:transglycosylase [Ensifer adhaerens]|uniref:Transglycosylase n=1 Tax=Ensifer adhaerens TaxID=106592 RepID=A0A0L8BG11_ENSAD|nr:lytic transglycosylase F [Ensifer adhaerens]KOF13538.1 transglycosylase [Ensifer adhaerens]
MRRLALFILLFAIVGIGNLQAQSNESTFEAITAPHLGDLDVMQKRRLIRIVVPFSKTVYFIDRGRQLGTAVEFGMALEKELNAGRKKEIEKIRIAFVPVPRPRLLTALEDGRGDIVMGNLTITEARLAKVDFTAPLFDEAREVLVTGPTALAIASVDDLSGQEVRVRSSSSYHEHLVALSAGFVKTGRAPISIKDMDENLEDEDVLEMINAGLLPWTVVDKYKADIWATVFRDIKVRDDILVSDHGQIAWAIRKDSPKLKATLDAFVKTHRVGTTFGNILKNSYYKSDKMLKRAYAPADVERFQKLVEIFRKHGDTYSFDYLMLMAQGYQESQLDQSRRSPRGAVGVMQLLPSTAADKSVGIKGIDKDQDLNVQAGSKYLRHLVDTYIADPAITPRNQLLFAFAAYNAGPGNLRKFRAKARDMGLNPDLWFGNVENAAAEIVGRETVQYVGNIYKYYVAYGLLAEHAREAPTAQSPVATDASVQ